MCPFYYPMLYVVYCMCGGFGYVYCLVWDMSIQVCAKTEAFEG